MSNTWKPKVAKEKLPEVMLALEELVLLQRKVSEMI